eukprot:jgi/Botrbrau1/811/Bobra.0352s0008.1
MLVRFASGLTSIHVTNLSDKASFGLAYFNRSFMLVVLNMHTVRNGCQLRYSGISNLDQSRQHFSKKRMIVAANKEVVI